MLPCIFFWDPCDILGVYPDMLHVYDLQIVPDAVWSTLLELTDLAPRRQVALSELLGSYTAWCQENSCLSTNCLAVNVKTKVFLLGAVLLLACSWPKL